MEYIINKNILELVFDSRKEMCLTLFRIQEFYEGLDGAFREKIDIAEFINLYSDKNGKIDYFEEWDGFNFSSIMLLSLFYRHYLNEELTNRERKIKKLVEYLDGLDGIYYIIAYVKGDKQVRKHELAHALFFIIHSYHAKSNEILNSIPTELLSKYKKGLKKHKYRELFFLDEINAYCVAYNKKEHKEMFGIERKPKHVKQLQELFKEYETIFTSNT